MPVPVPVPVPSLGSFLQLPAACRVLAGSFMAKSVTTQLDVDESRGLDSTMVSITYRGARGRLLHRARTAE